MSDTPTPAAAPAPVSGENPTNEAPLGQAPEPKKSKQFIDIDGESIDLEDLKRNHKKYKGADQKFREAAQLRQSAEEFYEQLQNDPDAVFNNPHLSAHKQKLAEKWMREQIEARLNPPDPRDEKLTETEKRLKAYEEKEAQAKEQEEAAQYQKVRESRQEAIAQTLHKALALTPLSKDDGVKGEVVAEMAKYLRLALQHGYEVSPDELAAHINNNRMRSYHQLAQQMDGDELISFLGEAIVHKMRKADLSRIRGQSNPPETAAEDSWEPRSNKPKRDFVDPSQLKRFK